MTLLQPLFQVYHPECKVFTCKYFGELVDSRHLSNKHGDLQQSIRVDVKTSHLTVDPDQPVLCLMLTKTSMCIKENTSIGRALGSGLDLLDMLQIVLLVSSLEIWGWLWLEPRDNDRPAAPLKTLANL